MPVRILPPALRVALGLLYAACSSLLAAAQPNGTPLLYEVRSATNVVYLFGTIHVGTRSMYPLNAHIQEAFAAARVLALEADPTDQTAAMAAMAQGLYQPPDNLRNHIGPELYARLEAALPGIGLPIEYARAMAPPLLAMTISMMEIQRLGYDPDLGLDTYLARQAKAQGKAIVQLESLSDQIALFTALPSTAQQEMLAAALASISDAKLDADVKDLIEAWQAGDAARIERNVLEELGELSPDMAKLLEDRLYTQRNLGMAAKVEQMLAGSTPVFVAVGAGHITGETGLPELLRKKGFAVRRL